MPATERTLASSVTPTLLSIGELAERTGVPTSALRYYDELGLVRPAARVAGRRRYAASAVRDVAVVLFFREIGFSLAETGRCIAGERQCPASEPMKCSRFWSIIEGRQRGLSLEESHARVH
jgi:DNA-binding transcriptional MerR regulator